MCGGEARLPACVPRMYARRACAALHVSFEIFQSPYFEDGYFVLTLCGRWCSAGLVLSGATGEFDCMMDVSTSVALIKSDKGCASPVEP